MSGLESYTRSEGISSSSGSDNVNQEDIFKDAGKQAGSILETANNSLPSATEETEMLDQEMQADIETAKKNKEISPDLADQLLKFYKKRSRGPMELSDLLLDNRAMLGEIKISLENQHLDENEAEDYRKLTLINIEDIRSIKPKRLKKALKILEINNTIGRDLSKSRLNSESAKALLYQLREGKTSPDKIHALLTENWRAINNIKKLKKDGKISDEEESELLSKTFQVETNVNKETKRILSETLNRANRLKVERKKIDKVENA